MYFTNDQREDGFGAQYQNILWSILYAELHDGTFLYSHILRMENPSNDSKKFVEDAVKTMNIRDKFIPANILGKLTILILKSPNFYNEIEQDIEKYHKSASFEKIKSYYYENKTSPFDPSSFHIAVHVRRPVAQDTRTDGANTPHSYYLSAIRIIQTRFQDIGKPLRFHIYSTDPIETFEEYKQFPVTFHLEEDTFETFRGMVFADVLVTSASSFSYVAALLSNGTIVYKPFWHPPRKHWMQLQ